MTETRPRTPTFRPSIRRPQEFAAQANATEELYREAEADRLAFWAEQANRLSWDTPFTEVLDWSEAPFAKWFVGGKLNVAYNCVDRHVEAGNGDRVAIHWEGEPDRRQPGDHLLASCTPRCARPPTRSPSWAWSPATGSRSTCRCCPRRSSRCWRARGSACMHSVVFAGFSATALAARIEDAEAKLVITTDGQYPSRSGGVAEGARRRGVSTGRSPSSTFLWCAAPELTHRGPRAATCGGTTPSTRRRPSTRLRRSTPSIRCSCSTRRAPPVSPRASCTPPAAT